MSITPKERRKYLKDISKQLVCSGKTKKKYLSDISGTVDDFIENNSGASLADLYENVGSPSEAANSLLMNENSAVISRKTNRVKWIVLIISAILVLLLTIVAFEYISLRKEHESINGTVTVYEEVSNPDGSVEQKVLEKREYYYDYGD